MLFCEAEEVVICQVLHFVDVLHNHFAILLKKRISHVLHNLNHFGIETIFDAFIKSVDNFVH